MFQIVKKKLGDQEEIRFSKAAGSCLLNSTTRGFALKYVSYGAEHYQFSGKTVRVKAGEFILVPDGVDFKVVNREKFTTGVCIDLDPSKLATTLPQIEELDILYGIPLGNMEQYPLGMSLQILEGNHGVDIKALSLNSVYYDLTQLGSTSIELGRRLDIVYSKIGTKQHVLFRLLAAKDYIHRNYKQRIVLSDLASLAGLSSSQLQRLFKLCFNSSPKQMQIELRMRKAAELILEDFYSMEEIAFDLGFTDLSAFSKQFKNYYNQPPSQFRSFTA